MFCYFICFSGFVLGEMSVESVFDILSYSISKIADRVDNIETEIVHVKEKLEHIERFVKNTDLTEQIVHENGEALKKYLNRQRLAIFRMISVEKNGLRKEVDNLNQMFGKLETDLRSEVDVLKNSFSEEFSSTKQTFESNANETLNSESVISDKLKSAAETMTQNLDMRETVLRTDITKATERLEKAILDQERQTEKSLTALRSDVDLLSLQMSKNTSVLSSHIASESASLSSRISTLSSKYSSLSSTMTSKHSFLSSDISSLSRRISAEEERAVGFTARLMAKKNSYAKSERIVFDTVYYNYGSGYSSSTGIFTAPKSGTYLFSFNVEAKGSGSVHAILMVNSHLRASAIVKSGPDMTGGNSAVVYVSTGARVWVETSDLQTSYYLWPYRSQFTGVLID